MDLQTLVLIGTFLLATIGGNFATARWLLSRISVVDERGRAGHKVLHERIDIVKDTFVRKDDMREHMDRIERGQEEIRKRLDDIFGRMMDSAGKGQ